MNPFSFIVKANYENKIEHTENFVLHNTLVITLCTVKCLRFWTQGLAKQWRPRSEHIWATSGQNQSNGMCAQRRLRSAWVSASLISLAVRMKKAWVFSYPLSAQRRLIRLGRCPGCSESSLGTQSFCWFCHEVAHFCCLPFCLYLLGALIDKTKLNKV